MELIIVGAGGLGREVFSWLSHEIEGKNDLKIKGFLDDNPHALGNLQYPVKIIGSISDYRPTDKDKFVLSILNPKIKKKIAAELLEKGVDFYTLIHPSTVIGANVQIGKGSIVCPNCILANDITVGDFVFINTSSTIGHNTVIGEYTSINGNVDITGNVEVGAECLFGVGAKVIPKRKIGKGATVGAGSVVIRNVKSCSTVFGNPAKRI